MSQKTAIKLASAEPVDKVTCKLCRRQFSKYVCPTCNVLYCSLTCFRSESHSQCSETFYKKEVEAEIQSEPSKSPQEHLKMMEMLKKFEEESSRTKLGDIEADEEEEGDEDDGTDLAGRFQDVDLDASSASDLWSKLTTDEQAKFIKALEDPNSELAQQLLASEELENETSEPWWDAPGLEDVNADRASDARRRFGEQPKALQIPASMVEPLPRSPPLLYNICAICIAYAYVTRHLAVSPLSCITPDTIDQGEGRRLITQLIPFLTDRKATTLYPNLSSLITDIWSRFEPGDLNSALFALLLRDAAKLIQPLAVIPLSPVAASLTDIDPASHPHRNLILVFSDLSWLFETPPPQKAEVKIKQSHVALKLLFYAAQMMSAPSLVLRALALEVVEISLSYEKDAMDTTIGDTPSDKKRTQSTTPVIEQI